MALLLPLALVAFLHASVGQAGASGSIAVMALAGLPAASIKPHDPTGGPATPSGGDEQAQRGNRAVLGHGRQTGPHQLG
jgi:hypothetical protein